MILDPAFNAKLAEIQRLLAEAYEHYFANSDGHCKSSEGAISINLPEYFWSFNHGKQPAVEIYSYVLGPHRDHYFDTIDIALENVRKWHENEMSHDYSADWYC